MKKLRTTVFASLLFINFIPCFGQGVSDHTEQAFEVNNFIEVPPSPDASSLGKYGDIPVSLYTGTPKIDIPIWEVSSGKLSLPVSLSYHAGGIKADDISSWVGLGWSLNSGGVVARTMRGFPDERDNGYFDICEYITSTGYSGTGPWQNETQFYWEAAKGMIDTEPDVFNFNFNGYSGKFVIQKEGVGYNAKLIPEQNLIVDVTIDNGEEFTGYNPYSGVWQTFSPEPSIVGFTITAPNGVKYTFSQVEYTHNINGNNSVGSISETFYPSSWYLTKVTTPFDEDEIIITYYDFTDETFNLYENYENNITETSYELTDGCGSPDCGDEQCPDFPNKIVTSTTKILSSKVHEIISDNQTIEFIPSTETRNDLKSESGCKLEEIHIKNNQTGVTVKVFKLYQSYYTNTSSVNEGDEYRKYRLRLDSIKEFSGDELLSKPAYEFLYNTTSLPLRGSYDQDHWGYYNGAGNSETFIPGDLGLQIEGADREANNFYSTKGLISKITYPTGGYTDFTFEGHDYFDASIPESTAESSRLLEFTTEDTEIETFINVTFDQNGYLDFSLSPVENNPIRVILTPINILTDYHDPEFEYETDQSRNSYVFTASDFPVGNDLIIEEVLLGEGWYRMSMDRTGLDDFPNSGYALLSYESLIAGSIENAGAGGARIKEIADYDKDGSIIRTKEYEYKQIEPGEEEKSSGELVTGIPNYEGYYFYEFVSGIAPIPCEYSTRASSTGSHLGNTQGSHIGYTVVTEYAVSAESNGKTIHRFTFENDNRTGFPYPPMQNRDWKRGLPEVQTVLDSADNNVKQVINNYDFVEYIGHLGIKAGFEKYGSLSDDWTETENYNILPAIYEINGGVSLNESTSVYEQGVSKIFDYTYDSKNQLKTETVYNSAKDTFKTIFYYPYDLTGEYYNSLTNVNVINEKVKTEKINFNSKNNDIISGLLTSYKITEDAIVVKDTMFNYEDGGYKARLVFDRYDEHGNIIQLHKINDIYVSYIWGYNSSLPVAKVENATYNEIVSALSQSEISLLNGNTLTNQEIRAKLNVLYDSLPDGVISTYIYHPLIGMASQTDPNGKITTYEYDGLGRLISIIDNDTNILKTYEYYYSTDNNPIEISGTILHNSEGLEGVKVTLSSGTTTYTDSNGSFILYTGKSFEGSISFEKEDYEFEPSSQSISNLSGDINISATAYYRYCTISGTIQDYHPVGIEGVLVELSDGSDSTTSGSDGTYSLVVERGWLGSLVLSKYGYSFESLSGYPDKSWPFEINPIDADYTNIDFEGTAITFEIGGSINGVSGPTSVEIEYTGLSSINPGSDGTFTKNVPYGWSGSVTPVHEAYTFGPAYTTYEPVTSDLIRLVTYNATLKTFSVSGYIKDNGVALSGVNVEFEGLGSVVTDASGYYEYTVGYNWAGTITPTKEGYSFVQDYINVGPVQAILINQDFEADILTYTISGTIQDYHPVGIEGVLIELSDGSASTTSNSDGTYSLTVDYGNGGTLLLSKYGYSFERICADPDLCPDFEDNYITQDYSGINFEGTELSYGIGGIIDGFSGDVTEVKITYSGLGDVYADTHGIFSMSVPYGWTGTVTPYHEGYEFSPESESYSNVTSDQVILHYTATIKTYKVSGYITEGGEGLSGVDVEFEGLGSVTTDANGYYEETVDYGWSGTVTPTKTGYNFSPSYKNYTNVTSDKANQNYTASLKTYTITATKTGSGSISPSGSVVVNYGSNKTFTFTPNSNYKVKDVKVDGVSQGALSSYTFSNITSNHTISVEFEVDYFLTTDISSLGFVLFGGSQSVTISSNVNWAISNNYSWIQVSPTSGSNSGSITITCLNTRTARSGSITITGGGITKTVLVTQSSTGLPK